jgi:protocatechuate 3,4-dioxygenase, beta subunit
VRPGLGWKRSARAADVRGNQAGQCQRPLPAQEKHLPCPINLNFGGCGPTLTEENGYYCFRNAKPDAYSGRNRVNIWRPAHVHVSVFGSGFAQRFVAQMYFDGDPLIPKCQFIATIPDPRAIEQLIAPLEMNAAIAVDWIAYKFDIVRRGRRSTLFDNRLDGNWAC